MNQSEQQQLQRMIREGNVNDVTEAIRERKHSRFLRQDMRVLQELLKEGLDPNGDDFDEQCRIKVPFCYIEYADIYNRVRKGNLDFTIMEQFLDVLEEIETGKLGQHDGAHKVGKLLKKIYVDSAIKQANKLDESQGEATTTSKTVSEPLDIGYKEFKNQLNRKLR